jgi:hypothetical protein
LEPNSPGTLEREVETESGNGVSVKNKKREGLDGNLENGGKWRLSRKDGLGPGEADGVWLSRGRRQHIHEHFGNFKIWGVWLMLEPFELNDKNEQEKTVNNANPNPVIKHPHIFGHQEKKE